MKLDGLDEGREEREDREEKINAPCKTNEAGNGLYGQANCDGEEVLKWSGNGGN